MFKKMVAILSHIFVMAMSCSQSGVEPQPANGYHVVKDLEWAQPDGHSLTMDIYTPQTGKTIYPVILIFHGGGWLINTNAVMDSMSIYLVQHAEYVVCNINYRLLGDQNNSVTMNQIVEDAMGAVLWVKAHITAYQGDPNRIIVTGDSAGGHLAAMVVLAGHRLESDGFDGESFGFNPSCLPAGKNAEQVAQENGLSVQAAVFSYAAFDLYASCLGGFETAANFFWAFAGKPPRGIFGNDFNVQKDAARYQAVSPLYAISKSSERPLPPMLCAVGSRDNLVTPASVQQFVRRLEENGHVAVYWEHQGRPHAYLDSAKNDLLGTEFRQDAVPALDRMIEFLDAIFYR